MDRGAGVGQEKVGGENQMCIVVTFLREMMMLLVTFFKIFFFFKRKKRRSVYQGHPHSMILAPRNEKDGPKILIKPYLL